jgi:Sel1 repeat
MSNVLSEAKRQQVIALGRLGWPLRRIEQETGVRRETASAYLKAAGVGVRPPGAWGRRAPAKPANEVTTGSDAGRVERTANPSTNPNNPNPNNPNPNNPENLSTKEKAKAKSAKPANEVTTGFGVVLEAENAKRSVCEPFREAIELGLSRGRNATAIWQDLVSESGFSGGYQTVKRYVRKLRGKQPLQPRAVIRTGPGEESQVDYGTGAMVRDPQTRNYRRTRLFVRVLGCSRKAARFLTFRSSSRIWAELGGATRVVVLDNLREGVLVPDIYPEMTQRGLRNNSVCIEVGKPTCDFVSRQLDRNQKWGEKETPVKTHRQELATKILCLVAGGFLAIISAHGQTSKSNSAGECSLAVVSRLIASSGKICDAVTVTGLAHQGSCLSAKPAWHSFRSRHRPRFHQSGGAEMVSKGSFERLCPCSGEPCGDVRQRVGNISKLRCGPAMAEGSKRATLRAGRLQPRNPLHARNRGSTGLQRGSSLFQKAADAGDSSAETNLGYLYDRALGVTPNAATAASWYRKAAETGNSLGEYNFADMYLRGEGLVQSDSEAIRWLQKAAEQGHPGARIKLAYMYAQGRGTKVDAEYAYSLITAASMAGDDRGGDLLSSLKRLLSPEQIAAAKARADACIPLLSPSWQGQH